MLRSLLAIGRPSGRSTGLLLWLPQTRLSLSAVYLIATLLAARSARDSAGQAGDDLDVITLVPAHDESASVAAAVRSLDAQTHPEPKRETIVIADNCSDDTAQIALEAGATVWERFEPGRPGKGSALTWALGRVSRERPGIDVIVVVDADCLASPNLLSALADALARQADAAQADYVASNPEASSTAALRAAGFTLKHRIRARGRARLGLSPGLFGTGMAFTPAVLQELSWSQSVTEDTELYLRLVERGRRIVYVGDAAVTSEMPTTHEDAVHQQLRWETGNTQLARTRLARLLISGLRTRDPEKLGAAVELALPSQTALVTGEIGIGIVALVARRPYLAVTAALTTGAQILYIVIGVAAAGGLAALTRSAADLPAFARERLRILIRVSLGGGARRWERTTRRSPSVSQDG